MLAIEVDQMLVEDLVSGAVDFAKILQQLVAKNGPLKNISLVFTGSVVVLGFNSPSIVCWFIESYIVYAGM